MNALYVTSRMQWASRVRRMSSSAARGGARASTRGSLLARGGVWDDTRPAGYPTRGVPPAAPRGSSLPTCTQVHPLAASAGIVSGRAWLHSSTPAKPAPHRDACVCQRSPSPACAHTRWAAAARGGVALAPRGRSSVARRGHTAGLIRRLALSRSCCCKSCSRAHDPVTTRVSNTLSSPPPARRLSSTGFSVERGCGG
jgi:hypothetical protein